MKGRESGMPEEDYWASFFDVEAALDKLIPAEARYGAAVEFGAGYGTFTLPAARRIAGTLTALDIEPAMIDIVRRKAKAALIGNIDAVIRDFVEAGTGLPECSQQHAMIYNLLHLEDPVGLLREAWRILNDGGSLSVIHWRNDLPTPRGPSLAIRPSPEQCRQWISEAGFRAIQIVNLGPSCPYHFGLTASKQR